MAASTAAIVTTTPTAAQLAAVRAAMYLFLDEDLARGTLRDQQQYCDACQDTRPAPGFLRYGEYALCNPCAVDYELARLHRRTDDVDDFTRGRQRLAA